MMTQQSTWQLAPYLRAKNAAEAIDWYVRALGATEKERYVMDNGLIVHAELDLHGNLICIADTDAQTAQPRTYNDVPISLYAQVPDVDAAFRRAVDAGAKADREPTDQDYGMRSAGFIDPYGHVWYLGAPVAQQSAHA